MEDKLRQEQIVFGWQDADKAASEIYSTVASNLLNGAPLFLYKNTSPKGNLQQLVVVRNYEYDKNSGTVIGPSDYGVYSVYTGYTAYLPHVPFEYLTTTLYGYLIDPDAKVDKQILEHYKYIIENYGK